MSTSPQGVKFRVMDRIDPDLPDWIKDHVRRYLETNGADGRDDYQAATDREIPVVVLERL